MADTARADGATSPLALVPVEFHGTTLQAVVIDGAPHVALKPIVEALGLDWDSQRHRIKRHPVLAQGAVITTFPSAGGDQETTLLPLSLLNGFTSHVIRQGECSGSIPRHATRLTTRARAGRLAPSLHISGTTSLAAHWEKGAKPRRTFVRRGFFIRAAHSAPTGAVREEGFGPAGSFSRSANLAFSAPTLLGGRAGGSSNRRKGASHG